MFQKTKFSQLNKGDISVDTLIVVIIGIIVLAVVIYLMFFYSKKSSFDCRLCSSKFAEWCQKCLSDQYNWDRSTHGLSWINDIPMSDDLSNCMNPCLGISSGTCPALMTECKMYIYIPNLTVS